MVPIPLVDLGRAKFANMAINVQALNSYLQAWDKARTACAGVHRLVISSAM